MEILYNLKHVRLGVSGSITWNPDVAPHIIIVGSTGSGKTYFTKQLLGKIARHIPKSKTYVMDYKGDGDFKFLQGSKRFYRYTDCGEGLQRFYEDFTARQSGQDKSHDMMVLLAEEWASYCNSLDKKVAEEEKKKLSNILMLGRSYNVHVIVSQQRADAAYFNTARDNFNLVIGLGNLSEESKNMLFHEFKSAMKSDRTRGTGYLLINGARLTEVCVPVISNMKKLEILIRESVQR